MNQVTAQELAALQSHTVSLTLCERKQLLKFCPNFWSEICSSRLHTC